MHLVRRYAALRAVLLAVVSCLSLLLSQRPGAAQGTYTASNWQLQSNAKPSVGGCAGSVQLTVSPGGGEYWDWRLVNLATGITEHSGSEQAYGRFIMSFSDSHISTHQFLLPYAQEYRLYVGPHANPSLQFTSLYWSAANRAPSFNQETETGTPNPADNSPTGLIDIMSSASAPTTFGLFDTYGNLLRSTTVYSSSNGAESVVWDSLPTSMEFIWGQVPGTSISWSQVAGSTNSVSTTSF